MDSPAAAIAARFADYLRALGGGDPAAAAALRRELFPLCREFATPARRKFPAPDRVGGDLLDDAVADVFLRLTAPEKARTLDPAGFPRLFRASARNAMIDVVRKRARRPAPLSLDAAAGGGTPLGPLLGREDPPSPDTAELRAAILAALRPLSADVLETLCDHLEGIVDAAVDGRYEALAARVPLGTVKSRLHKAHLAARGDGPLCAAAEGAAAGDLAGLHLIVPEIRELIAARRLAAGTHAGRAAASRVPATDAIER